MGTMFRAAVMNDILIKHPMNGVRYTKPVRAVDDIKFLTVDEQEKFMEVARQSHNYRQYLLLLETGLHPAALKDMVCSPAGTTIDAVLALEQSGFRSAVLDAVEACTQKAMEMSGK